MWSFSHLSFISILNLSLIQYWNTVGYGKVLCNVWYETCLVSHSLFSLSPGGHRYSYKSPHHFHTLGCSHEGRKVGSEGGRGQLVARGKVNPFLAITSGLAPKACWMREGEGRERVCCTPSLRCAAVFCLGALVRQGEWTLCEHCERRDWSVIGVNIGQQSFELRHPGGTATTYARYNILASGTKDMPSLLMRGDKNKNYNRLQPLWLPAVSSSFL